MIDDASNLPSVYQLAFKRSTQIKAVKVSLLVGTTLTLINQWQMLIGHHTVDMFCLTCTYLVPYLVVTYTVVREARNNLTNQIAPANSTD